MKYTYFISNFVPISLALIYIWRDKRSLLLKTAPILLILAALGLLNALAENPALKWGIWDYNLPHTFGILFKGVMLETYIYCILVPVTIGSAAVIFATRQDGEKRAKNRRKS